MVVFAILFGVIVGSVGTVILWCSMKVGADYEDGVDEHMAKKRGDRWNW